MIDNKIMVVMGEDPGYFTVDEAEDKITFETPVLEEIEYLPPGVTAYLKAMQAEGYLASRQLYLDYQISKKKIFLRGSWIFSQMGAEVFDGLIMSLQEISSDIKVDLYKVCCKDLLYVVAHKAYQRF